MQETIGTPIVDISSSPATFKLEGKTYTIRKAELGDYAACQQYIRDRKLSAMLDATSLLGDDLRAKAIGEILCKPMSLMDIWNEIEGEFFLLHRCLTEQIQSADGSLKPNPVSLKHILGPGGMPAVIRSTLTQVLMHICGLGADPTEATDEEPARSTPSIETPSAPSGGNKNLCRSAATTSGAVPASS